MRFLCNLLPSNFHLKTEKGLHYGCWQKNSFLTLLKCHNSESLENQLITAHTDRTRCKFQVNCSYGAGISISHPLLLLPTIPPNYTAINWPFIIFSTYTMYECGNKNIPDTSEFKWKQKYFATKLEHFGTFQIFSMHRMTSLSVFVYSLILCFVASIADSLQSVV